MRRVGPTRCEIVELSIDRGVVDQVAALRPAVVLVELDGRRFDLLRLCRSLCAVTDAWMIVTSSGTIDEATIVDALDAGADDVIANATPVVVDARLRVGLRVRPVRTPPPATIDVGDVAIDLRAHELRIGDRPVPCPPVQFELLVALGRQLGAVVGRDELLRTIWGAAGELNPKRLRIAVSAARRILGSAALRPRLETVTKIGYRLVPPRGWPNADLVAFRT